MKINKKLRELNWVDGRICQPEIRNGCALFLEGTLCGWVQGTTNTKRTLWAIFGAGALRESQQAVQGSLRLPKDPKNGPFFGVGFEGKPKEITRAMFGEGSPKDSHAQIDSARNFPRDFW